MHLSAALVACNDNENYLQFWPLVKRAWKEVVGISCIMIYVAEEIPKVLADDNAVIHFKPAKGWPTATQAQVIRLFYPALLNYDGALIISDMDIIPMRREYFVEGFSNAKPHQFVSLRGIDEKIQQIYMCYVGGTPSTFARIFNIHSLNDVYYELEGWAEHNKATGEKAGPGWCIDQSLLYNYVKEQHQSDLHLGECSNDYARLDRAYILDALHDPHKLIDNIKNKAFNDFHLPYDPNFASLIADIYTYIPKCNTL
jgi:hypothetical protein